MTEDGRKESARAEIEALRKQVSRLEVELENARGAMSQRTSQDAWFTSSFEHAPIGMALVSVDGHWVRVNPSFCKILGYSPLEVGDFTFLDLTHPEDRGASQRNFSKMLAGELEQYQYRKRYLHKDGRSIWCAVSVSLVRDQKGNPLHFIAQIEDISRAVDWERKEQQHREALEQREQFIRAVFDQTFHSLALLSPEGVVLDVNAAALRLADTSREELLGLAFWDTPWFQDLPEEAGKIKEALATVAEKDFIRYEAKARTSRGRIATIDFSVRAMRNTQGGIRMLIAEGRDITEKQRLMEALQTRELQLTLFAQYAPAAVAMFDDHLRYLVASARWYKDYGIEGQDIIGRHHYEIFPEIKGRPEWVDIHDRCLRGEIMSRDEDVFVRDDGEVEWLRWEIHPWHKGDSSVGGIIMFTELITERKQAEIEIHRLNEELEQRVLERTRELHGANQQLTKARDAAEAANKAKSAFLANMSHEIRTPMNAILGFAQLLEREANLSPKQREHLDVIHRSGRHLLALINDILEMSKIEAGRAEVQAIPFDLPALLEDVAMMFQSRCEEKGLQFQLIHPRPLCQHVLADGKKIRQILLNLLSNAVKFTARGGVVLRAWCTECQEGRCNLVVEVEDTGAGIAEEEQELLFQHFTQAQRDYSTEAGTGLGLAISREFVELMGGGIGVDSQPGKGSVFRFEVPLTVASEDDVREDPENPRIVGIAPNQEPRRVLVADDRRDNRILINNLLRIVGYEVREATNGAEAVDLFSSWKPHLVVMDIGMPILNGYEATRQIRQMPGGDSCVILAVSASAFDEDREEIVSAGCNDLVRKPVHPDQFLEMVGRYLGVRYEYAEMPGDSLPRKAQQMHSLGSAANLPEDLRRGLVAAIKAGDTQAIGEHLEEARNHDESMAEVLSGMAEDYAYYDMLALLNAGQDRG